MNDLRLNVSGDTYKSFYGSPVEQMPILIADNRIPLSVVDLMKQRLEILTAYRNASKELKLTYKSLVKAWWDNYFNTGDGAIRHNDGRLKFVPNAPYLRMLTPKSKLRRGAVILSNEVYDSLDGVEFSKAEVGKYFDRELSKAEVKEHPGWFALVRGNTTLLEEFSDATFTQAKERFRYNGNMMCICAPLAPKEGAAAYLWAVGKLSGYFLGRDKSGVDGYGHLDNRLGQLVGVALKV